MTFTQNMEITQNDFIETEAPAKTENTETIIYDNEDLIALNEPDDEIFTTAETNTFYNETVLPAEETTLRNDEYFAEAFTNTDGGLYPETQSFFKDISAMLYLILFFFIILLIISISVNLRKRFKIKALDCVILAEETFIHKRKFGKIKRLYAVHSFTKLIPALLRPFLSVKFAERMIDLQFREMIKFANLRTAEEPFFNDESGSGGEKITETPAVPKRTDENEKTSASDNISKNCFNGSPLPVNLLVEYPNSIYIREIKNEPDKQTVNGINQKDEHDYIFKRNCGQKGTEKIWITIF